MNRYLTDPCNFLIASIKHQKKKRQFRTAENVGKCRQKSKRIKVFHHTDPLQNRGSRVRILLPLPKTRKSMQRIGFFVFCMRLGRENPTPQSGVRVQRLAFLLCKMRSLTARQTCNGAKRSMESSCPCQKSCTKVRDFYFLPLTSSLFTKTAGFLASKK